MNDISIYKVKSCEFTKDGSSYPVGGFKLDIAENGIPSITVGFHKDPITTSSDDNETKVLTLTPSDYFDLYTQAQGWCDNRETASFKFEAEIASDGSSKDTQTLVLTDWLCAVSGFTKFSANGGLIFGLTLKHPVYAMSYSAANLTNLTKQPTKESIEDLGKATNPIDGLRRAMKIYADQYKKLDVDDVGLQKVNDAYQAAIDKFSKFFDADGLQFPTRLLSGVIPAFTDAVKESVYYSYASSLYTTGNPFQFITQAFLPDWFLSAKPKLEEGKLVVSPFEPWGEPKYTISVDNVSDFTFPIGEIEPLAGTYAALTQLEVTAATAWSGDSGVAGTSNITQSGEAVSCVPDPENSVYGAIKRIQLPMWFRYALLSTKIPTAGKGQNHNYGEAGTNPPDAAQIPTGLFRKYIDLVRKIVQEAYVTRYKASIGISVVTRFMLQLDGQDMLPGAVCDVLDGNSGIRFYISRVSHVIDIKGAQASTTLQGSFVRQKGGKITIGEGAAGETITNQLYF